QEAYARNSVNRVCPISLSVIKRRNKYGETLLHRAVAHEDVILLWQGGWTRFFFFIGWTALHEASVGGFYVIANELLKAGADVNARGGEQVTPLQDAVKEDHYEVYSKL
ncbi:ANR11 protein, partial [Nyctiprogne leucopyga]|nr:ANR11 protein [Nyctiprogne leucopyga]